MSFLLEYYPPYMQLINTPEYKQELMKFGINKKSKLIKISIADARNNKSDLILFRNVFPEVLKTVPVKFGKKTVEEERGIWIGWKKGDNFKVFKKKEAGGTKLNNLYNADFAYKVTIDRKEVLKKEFKDNNPNYNEKEEQTNKQKDEKFRIIKANKLIKELLDLNSKNVIKKFEEFEEEIIKNSDYTYTGFNEYNYNITKLIQRCQYLKVSENFNIDYNSIVEKIKELKKELGV